MTKAKWGPPAQRTQDGEMSVRASSCSHCRMTYKCGTCSYTSELYHDMYPCAVEKDAPSSVGFAGYARWLRAHSVPTARRTIGTSGPACGLQDQYVCKRLHAEAFVQLSRAEMEAGIGQEQMH